MYILSFFIEGVTIQGGTLLKGGHYSRGTLFKEILVALKAGNAGATAEKRLCNSDEFILAT